MSAQPSPAPDTVLKLYDAQQYPSDVHEQLMVKPITAVHRKRNVPLGSTTSPLLKVAPSLVLQNEDTEGLFACKPIQSSAMIKMTDMAVRMKINDLGMDLSLLRSDEARNSSRGFIDCWRKTMAQYCNLITNKHKWNVCEGLDPHDLHNYNNESILVALRAIKAEEELSVCYGIPFWLKECCKFATDRNVLGIWCVLAIHIVRDKALGDDEKTTGELLSIVHMLATWMEKSSPASQCGWTVPSMQQQADEGFVTLAHLDQYDAMFGAVDAHPAVSLADKFHLGPPSLSTLCCIQ